ncbi:MCE family protein [Rhodococcus erythropolis]|uniref:MCE family protein n=1 Tax=Rhodococcus erythropolis TaxID=1833 RepID=UPI00210D4B9A|nr:MCE family protein [Rhodococcus erythropolis]MCQ4127663.1 MCE family protein [Rhodococcus erythropolis]
MDDEYSSPRKTITTGIISALIVTIVVLAGVTLYAVNLGSREIQATFVASGGARTGDEVRVAGISVGNVSSVALSGTSVELTLAVDRDVRIGSDTIAAVKMLTPIGGRYVLLSSTSTGSSDETRIPVERTSVPYALGEIFDQATETATQFDGPAIATTLDALSQLTSTPHIADVIDNTATLTEIAARQHTALGDGLQVAREYTGALANDKDALTRVVEQMAWISRDLGAQRVEIVQAFNGLKRFLRLADRLALSYEGELEGLIEDYARTVQSLDAQAPDIEDALAQLPDLMSALTDAARGAGLPIQPCTPNQKAC